MNNELLTLVQQLNLKVGMSALREANCSPEFAAYVVAELSHFGIGLTYRVQEKDIFAIGHPVDLPEYARKVYRTASEDGAPDISVYQQLISETEKLFRQLQTNVTKKQLQIKHKKHQELAKRKSFHQAADKAEKQYFERLSKAHQSFNSTIHHWEYGSPMWKSFDKARHQAEVSFISEIQLAWQQAVKFSKTPTAKKSEAIEREAEMLARLEANRVEQTLLREQSFSQIFEQYFKQGLGYLSPFEAVHLGILEGFAAQHIPNNRLMVLGCASHDPNQARSLEGLMLHFYQGEIVLTRNQDELIQFYCHGDFLKNNILLVNLAWDMEKWEPVIQKQIKLGQANKIPEKTRAAYLQVQETKVQGTKSYVLTPEVYFMVTAQLKTNQPIPSNLHKLYTTANQAMRRPKGDPAETHKGLTLQFDKEKKRPKPGDTSSGLSPKKPDNDKGRPKPK